MTGRDLIIYILENHLEDEPVVKNGRFIGFMSVEEAAVKFGVGEATVNTWIKTDLIDSFKIDNNINIFKNAEHPRNKQNSSDAGLLKQLYNVRKE